MSEYKEMLQGDRDQPYRNVKDCLQEWNIYLTAVFKYLFLIRQETREGRCHIYLSRLPMNEREVSAYLSREEPEQSYGQFPIEMVRQEFQQMERHLTDRLVSSVRQGVSCICKEFAEQYEMNFLEMVCFFTAQICMEYSIYGSMVQILNQSQEMCQLTRAIIVSYYEIMYPEREAEITELLYGNRKAMNLFEPGSHLVLKKEVFTYIRRQEFYQPDSRAVRQWLRPDIPGTMFMNTAVKWKDLIVDKECRWQLEALENRIRYQEMVLREWGVAEKLSYGRGVSALFYGAPGTGKTMAAGVLAESLRTDLLRIEISSILSKYIGETEKNITALFQAAARTSAILFFDEADALFGKRTEVKNSNDRNANAETAHLLQCIEAYDGIVLLASNHRSNMDEAFTRRISFLIPFSFPTKEERYQMWKKMLPSAVPCREELHLQYYAETLELSGSSIKEILINAAYLAAAEGGLTNRHIEEAVRMNFQKYGRKYIPVDRGSQQSVHIGD